MLVMIYCILCLRKKKESFSLGNILSSAAQVLSVKESLADYWLLFSKSKSNLKFQEYTPKAINLSHGSLLCMLQCMLPFLWYKPLHLHPVSNRQLFTSISIIQTHCHNINPKSNICWICFLKNYTDSFSSHLISAFYFFFLKGSI